MMNLIMIILIRYKKIYKNIIVKMIQEIWVKQRKKQMLKKIIYKNKSNCLIDLEEEKVNIKLCKVKVKLILSNF